MSWDDDEWDAPAAAKDDAPALTDKWDGEDEDDETLLGDDWDADPAEKKAETEQKVQPGTKKLTKRQLAKKKEEEERLAALSRSQYKKDLQDDPDAEGRRRAAERAAIEKANLGLTMDLFGGDGYEAPPNGEFVNKQLDLDNTDMAADVTVKELKKMKIKDEPLEDVVLKKKDDYEKFAKKVAEIVTKDDSKGKQKMIIAFAKKFLEEATKKMKLDDCTDIKKAFNVICNQKQKDEAGKKKKGGAKKAQLTMSRGNDYGDDDYGDDGGMMDDFL